MVITVGRMRSGWLGIAAIAFIVAATCRAESAEPTRYEFTRIRMGVPFNITVYAPDEAAANSAADAAYRRIKELNDVFSDYDPRSEISRLLREAEPGKPFPISRDLLTVLERADQVSQASDGAFDVTVGPVVKLWRRSWRSKQKPAAAEIANALSKIGFRNVSIDREHSTVTLAQPGLQLDFGAIAKGYACDEALAVLKSKGFSIALVEAGGDLACGDPPPGETGWAIAIEALAKGESSGPRFLVVKNCGVATSGDAYQFVEFDGVRYSHIVDPKTGLGLTRRSSVTVIAKDGTEADALASAVSVLGPEKGKSLIEKKKTAEVRMVYVDEAGTPHAVESSGFKNFEVQSPEKHR
jgi:thiamine biosynthesis lipoprotein